MKFTDTMIRNLKADKKKYLRESNGFTIRVMPSGVKTWLFVYTTPEGRRKEMNLGNYPSISLAEAKQKYNDAYSMLQRGIDPGTVEREKKEERKRTPFISDFTDEYIERYAKEHNRGWKEIERALKAEIVSRWGNRKITDIKRRDLVLVLDEIKERGAPIMANRVLAYMT